MKDPILEEHPTWKDTGKISQDGKKIYSVPINEIKDRPFTIYDTLHYDESKKCSFCDNVGGYTLKLQEPGKFEYIYPSDVYRCQSCLDKYYGLRQE